jgi:hypothetical protein
MIEIINRQKKHPVRTKAFKRLLGELCARYRLAAKAERSFYPGGRSDAEVESTVDYSPNQQLPRPNPRWVELGAPLGSPAP